MRPEYLEALQWARWNHWVIAMWLAPILLIGAASRSWKLACLAMPVAIVACFVFFWLGVDYYWEVKERIAQTEEEWNDVTSDAARLYGPILVGPPFAIMYCSLLAVIINPAVWLYNRLKRSTTKAVTSSAVDSDQPDEAGILHEPPLIDPNPYSSPRD
jgi:hypothetical protein